MRWVVLLPFLFVLACGSDSKKGGNEEPQCLATLPECPGSECLGRIVRNCNEDGTEFRYELCFAGLCKNGLCQSAPCTEPEASTCVGPTTRRMCLPSMAAETQIECDAGDVCIAGACVSSTCTANTKGCGWKAKLVCAADGSGWKNTPCGDNQYCDPTSFECTDMAPFCLDNPGGATCIDLTTAATCDNLGKLLPTSCSGDQVCVNGFCQGKVCGKTYGDPRCDRARCRGLLRRSGQRFDGSNRRLHLGHLGFRRPGTARNHGGIAPAGHSSAGKAG